MAQDALAGAAPLWDRLLRGYSRVSRVRILATAMFMFALMVGVNAVNIGLRAFHQGDIQWVQELSILAAMWVYFAAYALIAKEDGYVRIEFLADICRFASAVSFKSLRGSRRSSSRRPYFCSRCGR